MKIPFNKKWVLMEKEDYANYLFVSHAWRGFTFMQKEWGFELAHFMAAQYVDTAVNLFMPKDVYDELSQKYFASLFICPKKWDRLNLFIRKSSDNLIKFGKQIKKLDVKKLSNHELLQYRQKFEKLQMQCHVPRGCMWIIEGGENILTNYLQKYLDERIDDLKIKNISTFDAFRILITPVLFGALSLEKEALVKIAQIKNKEEQEKALFSHAKKYEWLEYGLQGKILSYGHFAQELKKIKNPLKILTKMRNEIMGLGKRQKEISKKFKIHPKHQKIFQISRDSMFYKVYAKDAQFFGYYCIENLLREIGKRAGLTLEQVRFLSIEDYPKILLKGKDFSKLTNERMKYSVHISDRGKTVFYVGKKARQLMAKIKFYKPEQKIKESSELKGQPAYTGMARGKVKIINTAPEMVKMHQGDILVSHMTNPDIVPVMKKASAIVTDIGGITSHAAIVARELKKPCIIGTKIATKVLRDGDMVEVDANKGVVKKI